MARINSQFRVGGGVLKCTTCGKRTRDTGYGERHTQQCKKCIMAAEQENAHFDGVHDALGPTAGCPICVKEGRVQ